jgi:hypothetical protein
MIVIENDNCIFFDVDDTLVMWDSGYVNEDSSNTIQIKDPYFVPMLYGQQSASYTLVPHDKHIQYLKDAKIKNKNTIVVWSAGGWEWAKSVVAALELEEYVDAIMSKPKSYVDDLSCNEFMGNRIYKEMKKGE